MQDEYFITKGGAYYRPNAEGYTTCRGEAGRFSLEDAIKYSHPNGPDGPRDGIHYEVAPPQNEPPVELVERVQKEIGPFTLRVQRHENYSGEHREWYEEITLPKNCTDTPQIIRAVLAAVTPQIEARVTGEIAKRFDHIRSDLNNISRAIEDEGDRCYLGSTNDADELRRIAQRFEDWLLAHERGDYRSNGDAE